MLSPVSIQTQRTQRKRLRLDGNRALLIGVLFVEELRRLNSSLFALLNLKHAFFSGLVVMEAEK